MPAASGAGGFQFAVTSPYSAGLIDGYGDVFDLGSDRLRIGGIENIIEYNGFQINVPGRQDRVFVNSIDGLADADVRDTREPNPGYDGETAFESYYGGRTIVISGTIKAGTLNKLRDMQEGLKSIFAPLDEAALILKGITPEYDLRIFCRKTQPITMGETQKNFLFEREFQVTLRASDFRFTAAAIEEDYWDWWGADETNTNSYSALVLGDTPTFYWRMNEASGATSFINSVASGTYAGTINGSPSGANASGAVLDGSYWDFNGSSSYVSSSAPAYAYASGTSTSFEAWFYRDSTTTEDTIFSSSDQYYGSNISLASGTGSITFNPDVSMSQKLTFNSSNIAASGAWKHLVLTVTNSSYAGVLPTFTNPSFDTNSTGWTAGSSTISRITNDYYSASGCGIWDNTGASDALGSGDTLATTLNGTFEANTTYTITGKLKSSASPWVQAKFGTSADNSNVIGIVNGFTGAANQWNTIRISWTPQTTVSSGVNLTLTNINAAYHKIDSFEIKAETNIANLYINSTLVGSGGCNGFSQTSSGAKSFQVARSTASTDYFDGKIAEVAVYPSALTPDKIFAHYNSRTKYFDTLISGPVYARQIINSGNYLSDAIIKIQGPIYASGAGQIGIEILNTGDESLNLGALSVTATAAESVAQATSVISSGNQTTALAVTYNNTLKIKAPSESTTVLGENEFFIVDTTNRTIFKYSSATPTSAYSQLDKDSEWIKLAPGINPIYVKCYGYSRPLITFYHRHTFI